MQFVLCGAMVVFGGCAGIQGGSEGEEGSCGASHIEPLVDPDAVPRGFERTPREIFEVAAGRYDGTLAAPNVGVSLQFLPTWELLSVSYSQNEHVSGCAPWIELPATASLSTAGEPTAAQSANLLFRTEGPEAAATFVAAAGTPLASLAPAFSGPPNGDPSLDVHLYGFVDGAVLSDWRWSALVCSTKQACSGSPGPGQPAAGGLNEEVAWGQAELTRQ